VRILAAGGGSGGHVTPVVAVLRELRKIEPDTEIRFWVDHAFEKQARTVMGGYDDSIRVDTIVSGKLRRYHHLKWWQQLMKFRTITLPNIIDVVKVSVGFMQCLCKLIAWRPDVVFTKGGYVCLPVGLAAHVLRIPLVIHDSDAHPGLTNRVLARWADAIGTGAPLKFYPYPREISQYVGVPIMEDFVPYSDERRRDVKVKLGFDPTRPLVVVTGGGLGARRINDAVVAMLPQLTKQTNVIIDGGKFEVKQVSSPTAVDTRTRTAIKQVSTDGGIIYNATDWKDKNTDPVSYIRWRAENKNVGHYVVVKDGEVVDHKGMEQKRNTRPKS
jgi:UDP-N-acetylglucosamine--N-acetylmuramyl-(pentapeptide) pyrophosphoryl-undecaprenol N-acetylglucosamine transferase